MSLVQKPTVYQYDPQKYPFREAIQAMLGETELEQLHNKVHYDIFERKNDQSSTWHRRYYDNFDQFTTVYHAFISEFIKAHFDLSEVIYQKIPTFRAHLVNNLGVGEWHRDRDYNHGKTEMNVWLPFTNAYGTNTIWMESEEGKEDFEAYTVNYGEFLFFSGANLLHGNKINDTNETRVSVDFRIVSPSEFVPSDKGSINMNSTFAIGGYFDKM